MSVSPSAFNPKPQFESVTGAPLMGALLFTYLAGSNTKTNTYTDSTGATPNTNPIVLNAMGQPSSGYFWTDGTAVKVVLAPSTDTDPPTSPIFTVDNLLSQGSAASAASAQGEWILYSAAPTFISATSFSVAGNQTTTFQPGRRTKTANTGGTIYSTIIASVFGAVTTVTVINDSGVLDSGLSAVSYGLISANNSSLLANVGIQDFRITLTSGTPVTTTDVTGAATIYCTPYKGSRISLYTASGWVTYQSAEFSLALSGLVNGRPYDVFCYSNAGVPTLEFLAWTSTTARATALVYQDGILVKSGATTRRYLNTFYTTSATTTEDSQANRYLWNYYNRISRPILKQAASASWTYAASPWRQAQGSTANQINFVIGVAEDTVNATVTTGAIASVALQTVQVAVGINTITGPSSVIPNMNCTNASTTCLVNSLTAFPAIGLNYLAFLERTDAAGTVTFSGSGSGGIFGALTC